MGDHTGKVFGITFGIVVGVLLGLFVHFAIWSLLPVGICIGFFIDSRNIRTSNTNPNGVLLGIHQYV